MIAWCAPRELRTQLAPLLPCIHGRSTCPPREWFERQPCIEQEEGLGEVLVWAGRVGPVPFEIAASSMDAHWGLEVRLPAEVSVATMLDVFCAVWSRRFGDVYFEKTGEGVCRVVGSRDASAIFVGARSECVAVVGALRAIYGGEGVFSRCQVDCGGTSTQAS